MSVARLVEKKGIEPLGKIVAYAASGLEPKWVMMAPEPAVRAVAELELPPVPAQVLGQEEAQEGPSGNEALAVPRKD